MSKRIITIFILVICIFVISLLFFLNGDKRKLNDANKFSKNGQTSEAITIFKRLVNNNKLGTEAKYGLAKTYIKMNNYKDAEKELVSLINNKPDYFEANIELCNLYKKQNRIEDSYKVLKKYYALNKDRKAEKFIDEAEKEIRNSLVAHVKPNSGDVYLGDFITINVPQNCSTYYTIDGTKPNKNSQKYTEKIRLSKGGNLTLNIIIINNNSDISNEITYKYNVKFKDVILNQELQRKLNVFMSNFAEVSFDISFEEGKISDRQLILFGFRHNYRNYYRGIVLHGTKRFEFEDSHDKLKKEYIDDAVKRYFNIKKIQHQTIAPDENSSYKLEYRNGYYYQMHGDGESPIDYSVVFKIEDIGDGKYIIYTKNYHTSEYNPKVDLQYDFYSLNFAKSEQIYKDDLNGYEVEMVMSKIQKINENGSERYILLEYKLNN
ncbi:tetratricopeptide repeat protein [Clostridium sp.]|uniref:tetratricopeptide repeat protein n=1 Tax=Clostridium sp. TaxID=1506 RepID=UPI003D6C89B4